MAHYILNDSVARLSDTKMVAVMRFALAFSALLIILLIPSESDRYVFTTYVVLILYVLYSAAIFFLIKDGISFFEPFLRYLHWTDIAWSLLLISLSSGSSSIFYFYFLFVVLYTSFTYGFPEGFRVTIYSVLSFSLLGFLTSPSGQEFELDRFLLRPINFLLLGYMMAYWGGYEIRTKRRLELLRDIVALSNPRFGVDRTLGTIAELLRNFYNADGCLLLISDPETSRFSVNRADRHDPEATLRSRSMTFQAARKLFPLPENCAAVFEKPGLRLLSRFGRFNVSELPDRHNLKANRETFENIAEQLDAGTFLTVPVYHRKQAVGRIFIFSQRISFDTTDIDFLLQVTNQFMPIVENIRLVDHLASSAAEEERKKIARDIHDSVIQPYIGLQLGIDSVINFFERNSGAEADSAKVEKFKTRINRLRDLTKKGIEDLRVYTNGLSQPKSFETSLLSAIRSYAEKFGKATGISVEIEAENNFHINDRLAAEIFQIVAEGLSNVRRHTHSHSAHIKVSTDDDKISLAISNNKDDNVNINFIPRSIAERVDSLGGFLQIRQTDEMTVVRLEIPL